MMNQALVVSRSAAVTFLGNVKKYNNRITNKVIDTAHHYDEKFKGKMIGNWIRYWKNLYTDYKDVVIDVRKECKERPVKAGVIFTSFGVLWSFMKTNPDEVSFRDSLLSATNELILVNPSLQKKSSAEHLRLLEKCYNRKMIKRQSFLFMSVMWVDSFSCDCNKFDCQCPYLEVSYLQFFRRIIDVGFINRWWILEKQIEDYDVNF